MSSVDSLVALRLSSAPRERLFTGTLTTSPWWRKTGVSSSRGAFVCVRDAKETRKRRRTEERWFIGTQYWHLIDYTQGPKCGGSCDPSGRLVRFARVAWGGRVGPLLHHLVPLLTDGIQPLALQTRTRRRGTVSGSRNTGRSKVKCTGSESIDPLRPLVLPVYESLKTETTEQNTQVTQTGRIWGRTEVKGTFCSSDRQWTQRKHCVNSPSSACACTRRSPRTPPGTPS